MVMLRRRRQGPLSCRSVLFVRAARQIETVERWSAESRVCAELTQMRRDLPLLLWTLYRCRLTACSAFPQPKTVNQIRRRDRCGTFRRIGYHEHDSPVGHLPTCTMAPRRCRPNAVAAGLCGIGMEFVETFLGLCRKSLFSVGAPPAERLVESPTAVAGGSSRARRGLDGVILTIEPLHAYQAVERPAPTSLIGYKASIVRWALRSCSSRGCHPRCAQMSRGYLHPRELGLINLHV